MSQKPESKSARLQELIHRRDRVLAVLHPPTAAHARIMEKAGCEALFVGTGGVVGAYTGLSDVGTATMTECVTIAGWIADSVSIPVIMDGDTGHGGIMAVRRMVRECIRAGIAGIRIDDQPIEGKRKTQSAGVEVVPVDQAIARYRAAVEMKNELDPNFVVMAQCYARMPSTERWRTRSHGCGFTARRLGSTGCNSSRPIRWTRSEPRAGG
jgi:2,3-dimethylmalate lyase